MKIIVTVSCLEWLTCLLLFTVVEFEKLQFRFKNDTHFSCYKSLSKGYKIQGRVVRRPVSANPWLNFNPFSFHQKHFL